LILEWEKCEKFVLHLNGSYPTNNKPSRPFTAAPEAPNSNGQKNDRGDGMQARKAKKFLKPSKEGTKFIYLV
jgi:hypothetical protein